MFDIHRIVALVLLCLMSFAAHAADGDFVWARGMGGNDFDTGHAIAVDSSGNVYTAGEFGGTTDFDPGAGIYNLTSAGLSDIFVQKLDASGNLVWARSMGGTQFDYGYGIAIDSAGGVYTTGFFEGTADFDPGAAIYNLSSAGEYNIFVQKLDVNGNFVWARGMGGTDRDVGLGIAVDNAGNVYTTGEFGGTTDFDPGAGLLNLTAYGFSDIFVQKLDASGNLLWARGMGGPGPDSGNDIAVDSAGNVYTTGQFDDTVDFDPGVGTVNLTSAEDRDIFMQKLDASGNLVWARDAGETGRATGYGIAVDRAGNVFTTGYVHVWCDYDDSIPTLICYGTEFIRMHDADGNFVWSRKMGWSRLAGGSGIAVDTSGNIYTTGVFDRTVDFDPGVGTVRLTSAGLSDIFVQKLDASGNLVWAQSMGGTQFDFGYDIALDSAGNVYTTGQFDDTVDFDTSEGTFNLTSSGSGDFFVQKLRQDFTPPNVASIVPATLGPTNEDSAAFTVTFDEDVRNFDAEADLLISHSGTASTGATISGGPLEYAVTISGITGDGSLRLSVNSGSDVQDLADNALATSVTSAAVTVDNTPPAVSIGAPSASLVNRDGAVTFPVMVGGSGRINLESASVVIDHNGTSGGSVVVLDRMTVSPRVQVTGVTGDGSYSIGIAAGVATDAAGNMSLAAGPSAAVNVDNAEPVFSDVVANPAEASAGDTVSISFDSSEPVAGEPEVTVNGNPATRLAKSDYSYEYSVQSRDVLGAATITISAADALGNVGALGDSTLLEIVRAEGEGEGDVEGEGSAEGEGEGSVEGAPDGEGEGVVEGVDEGEGEGENPPAGSGGCNATGGPMEKSIGDWLAVFLGFAVLLGAHLSLRSRLEA